MLVYLHLTCSRISGLALHRGGSGEFLKSWGRPHPEGAERLLGHWGGLGVELERDSLHFDLHLLNAVKRVQHLGEAGLEVSVLEESALQSCADQEGEEEGDDVASDPRPRPVAHRPELQRGLEGAEGSLESPERLVGLRNILRWRIGRRIQDPETVIAGVPLHLFPIDRGLFPVDPKEPTEPRARHQALHTSLLEPLLKAFDHRLPPGCVPADLVGVPAEYVADASGEDLLHLQALGNGAEAPGSDSRTSASWGRVRSRTPTIQS